jgi:hypothetical protein
MEMMKVKAENTVIALRAHMAENTKVEKTTKPQALQLGNA